MFKFATFRPLGDENTFRIPMKYLEKERKWIFTNPPFPVPVNVSRLIPNKFGNSAVLEGVVRDNKDTWVVRYLGSGAKVYVRGLIRKDEERLEREREERARKDRLVQALRDAAELAVIRDRLRDLVEGVDPDDEDVDLPAEIDAAVARVRELVEDEVEILGGATAELRGTVATALAMRRITPVRVVQSQAPRLTNAQRGVTVLLNPLRGTRGVVEEIQNIDRVGGLDDVPGNIDAAVEEAVAELRRVDGAKAHLEGLVAIAAAAAAAAAAPVPTPAPLIAPGGPPHSSVTSSSPSTIFPGGPAHDPGGAAGPLLGTTPPPPPSETSLITSMMTAASSAATTIMNAVNPPPSAALTLSAGAALITDTVDHGS